MNKDREKIVMTMSIDVDVVDWIDKIRKTSVGEVTRPQAIRVILRRAKEELGF